jgi:Rrf2 family protein
MTAASEYGCLALLAIAEHEGEWCKRGVILERFEIPAAFLEQILRKLSVAGFVVSRRGADGGFRLARPAGEIAIADVMRALDGPLAPVRSVSENFYQPSPVEASAGFHALFRKVRDVVAELLEGTTLEDVLHDEQRIRRQQERSRNRPAPRRTVRGA